MRVLQVLSCLELGGTEAFVLNLYRKIDQTECQFDFLVFYEKNYPHTAEIEKLGGRIFFVDPPNRKNVFRFIRKTIGIVRKYGPYQAVHSHVNITNSWVMLAARLAGIPVRVSHSHAVNCEAASWLKQTYHGIEKYVLRRCSTNYLACSEIAGASLYGNNFFAKQGTVIKNGIDERCFITAKKNEMIQLEWGMISRPSLVIGNITRFDSNKNQEFCVRVFERVLNLIPDTMLVLGGLDGGTLQSIKELVHKLGLDQKVSFIGPRKDIPDCLALIDIYLFPSLSEGFGISLLEAQAAGCLCIASDTVPEESDIGLNCVKYLNLNMQAEKWAKELVLSWERFEKPTKETILQKFAQSEYSACVMADKIVRIYRNEQ